MFSLFGKKSNKQLSIEGFLCKIIYSKRRSISLEITQKEVIVRANYRTSDKRINEVIKKRAGWLTKKLELLKTHKNIFPIEYTANSEHLFLGKTYLLKLEENSKENIFLIDDKLLIEGQELNIEQLKDRLDIWYSKQAQAYFSECFETCWQRFCSYGFNKPKIRIKRMKSRWGSLSTSGFMSLNLELIKLPTHCLYSVIYHELCHLAHMNHSKDFYDLLDEVYPSWHQSETILKAYLLR